MFWIIMFAFFTILSFIVVPINSWKQIWPSIFVSLIVLYVIETTMVSLDTYIYNKSIVSVNGMPLFYWLSAAPICVLFIYLLPQKKVWQLPYILAVSLTALTAEIIAVILDYFEYENWQLFWSYLLDINGFTVTLWLALWLLHITGSQRFRPRDFQ